MREVSHFSQMPRKFMKLGVAEDKRLFSQKTDGVVYHLMQYYIVFARLFNCSSDFTNLYLGRYSSERQGRIAY